MNTESARDEEPPGADDLTVEVSDTQAHMTIEPGAIARLVRETLRAEEVDHASISVALVDDSTIRAINARHLDHDWPTDVISFVLSEPDDALAGELVVSAEMAAATAGQAGVPAWDELSLYVVHGLLHLCGYDDADDASRATMRRREGEILAILGLSNTYPAATVGGPAGAAVVADAGEGARSRWTA